MKYRTYLQKHWIQGILAVILLVSAVLRFYNTPNRYGFDFDASRDALLTLYSASHLTFPLVGPASALGSFHFGPWYYYFLIIFHLIFPYSYSPWILNSLMGIMSVFVAYKVGEELYDVKFGLLIALFVALSPAQIIATTGLSNPDFVILPSFIIIWLFIKHVKGKLSWWYTAVWGLILGISINIHFQMLTYLVFPLFGLLFTKQKKNIYITSWCFGIATAFLPWVFFDMTHQWININGFFSYLMHGNGMYVPNSWVIYLRDFWLHFWVYVLGVPIHVGILIGITSLICIGILGKQKKVPLAVWLLLTAFMVLFLYFRYYSGVREVYYTLFLHPFIFIIAAFPLWYVYKLRKGFIMGTLLVFCLISIIIARTVQEFHTMDSHVQEYMLLSILSQQGIHTYQVYDCSEKDRIVSQGLAFVGAAANRLQEKGEKIGIWSSSCPIKAAENITPLLQKIPIQLVKIGEGADMTIWQSITGKYLYESTLK